MRELYPPIEPRKTGFIEADGHKIYFEESGNPEGQPVIFLHGGPGSGTDPKHRRFFNPKKYRIVLMDQRGCGKSLPHASLEKNTTWDLVADIERLRVLLGIEKWIVFGGSWGSTLALVYAESHPSKVKGLIIRGIFLCRKKELHWFYQFGAHHIFPEEWQKFLAPIPVSERNDMIAAYYKRLTSKDRKEAAYAWSRWEGMTIKLEGDPEFVANFTADEHADAIARIECHYFMNKAFLKTDNWIIEQIDQIRHIPTRIIHGRYDIICPVENAWDLSQAFPEAKLEIIPNAGHVASEPGICDALIRATDEFAI